MTSPDSAAGQTGSTEIWTYEPPHAGLAKRFLWWCAGADPQILARCTYAEHVKFASIGGVVLATGILATVTMWFGMFTVFESTAVAAVVAVFWGLMIFNLDRFIVSSTGKGDGEETISKSEWINATPRLFMAFCISIVVATPLETKIFERELDQWIAEETSTIKNTERRKHEEAYATERAQTNTRVNQVQQDISKLDAEIAAFDQSIRKEIAGENASGPSCGKNCNALEARKAAVEKRREALAVELSELQRLQQERQDEIDTRTKENAGTLERRDGLLARVILVHERAFWPAILITLVLLSIECAPILFKLMLVKGPYDYIEESVKDVLRAQEGVETHHRWQPIEGHRSGGVVVADPPIHHRARIELARRREAADTQIAVEAAAWQSYREALSEDARQRPQDFLETATAVGPETRDEPPPG